MTRSTRATDPAPPPVALERIEARLLPSRLRHGLRIHGLELGGERALPVVRCLAAGSAGHGEAPPLQSFTGESAADTLTGLERAAAELTGLELGAALERLHAPRFATPPVRAALDVALHELWARLLGLPLHALLGPLRCPELPISRAIGYHPPERVVELARDYVGSGVGALKLKVGREPDTDAGTLLAVRAVVGDGVELAADANGAFDLAGARRFLDRATDAGLAYLEQPLPRGDLAGSRLLRGRGVPIGLDEGVSDADEVARAAAAEAVDVVIIKLIKCGGLRPALDMARSAAAAALPVLVVDPLGSAVSLDAGLHLAAILPPPPWAHGLSAGLEVTAAHAPHRPVERGRLRLTDAPGLGGTVAWPERAGIEGIGPP